MFGKKVDNQAKKVDKVITGLIIGTAIASMVGLSKTKKGKKVTDNIKTSVKDGYTKGKSLFGRTLIAVINFFKSK